MQKYVGTHGARGAGLDCMLALAALTATSGPEAEGCTPQELAMSAALQRSLLACGGLEAVLSIARSNGPPASAGAAACIVLEMFRTLGPDLCGPFAAAGGIQAMVRILQNTYVRLPQHAAAAGNLWYFLVPDQRLTEGASGKGPAAPAGDAAAGLIAGKPKDVRCECCSAVLDLHACAHACAPRLLLGNLLALIAVPC
jgi:hypothetical protein